jgi:GntR family transcriptional regulator
MVAKLQSKPDQAKPDAAAAVDDRLPTPLYHQIYLVLRGKIADGEFAFGDVLPSEDETARTYGVSRITAKRALNELAEDGFVVRERGRGTRVTHRAPARPVQANVEGLLENLLAMGLETEVELIDFGYVTPGEDVRRALGCGADESVQRAVRVRRLEGEPFSHLTTFVPGDIGRTYGRDDLASTPLLTLLERGGVQVGRAEQTISATLADATVARLLGVDLSAPLLRISRTVYDQQNRPVEYITGLYRPDRYQYRMELSRVQTGQAHAWSPSG